MKRTILFLVVLIFTATFSAYAKEKKELELFPVYKQYIIAVHNGSWGEVQKYLSSENIKMISVSNLSGEKTLSVVKELVPQIGEPIGIREKVAGKKGTLYLTRKKTKNKFANPKGEITFVKELRGWKILKEDWSINKSSMADG